MRYIKKFNEDLYLGFQVDKVLKEWNIPLEYFEDIFVEFYDMSNNEDVAIQRSSNDIRIRPNESGYGAKYAPVLYINALFKMKKEVVDVIVKSISNRLFAYNIKTVWDKEYKHEKTILGENIWFVSLRLINIDDYKKAKDQDVLSEYWYE